MDASIFSLLNRATSIQMDWRLMKPNLQLVNHFYQNQCGNLYDGYRVPTANPNGTLAGDTLVATTMPGFFGYSEYYELYENITVVDDATGEETQRVVVLWCGQLYNAFLSSARWSGAQVTFRAAATTLSGYLDYMLDPRMTSFWIFGFDSIFKFSPFFQRGPFVLNSEDGNIMARNIELRREFAFLECFTPTNWLAIGLTLLLLSVLTSKLVLIRKRPRHRVRLKPFTFSDWFTVLLDMVAIMLAESAARLERYRRDFVGLWYVACIIFCGCLSGTMLDLMSKANVVIKPQDWSDLFYCTFYDDLTLALFTDFPYYTPLSNQYGTEIAIRESRDKLLLLDMYAVTRDLITSGGSSLWPFLRLIYYMAQHFDLYLLVVPKMLILIIFWMCTVCDYMIGTYMSEVFEFLENTDDKGIYRDEPLPVGYEAVNAQMISIMDMVRNQITISPGRGSINWYLVIHKLCLQTVVNYLHHL